ncbi:hypothetical protein EGW08_004393 [Elysia chlorotica]|uniref:Uncharacterized protein n=1 Tax=Elysia chlorotica TaxID=188477 RepID=A0A3S1A0X4_ELYCH|nr:hypothetical protein EGW08_004393 [Elysia chlorotica]
MIHYENRQNFSYRTKYDFLDENFSKIANECDNILAQNKLTSEYFRVEILKDFYFLEEHAILVLPTLTHNKVLCLIIHTIQWRFRTMTQISVIFCHSVFFLL